MSSDGPATEMRVMTCPACHTDAVLAADIDRYFHTDGTANRPCWIAVTTGRANRVSRVSNTSALTPRKRRPVGPRRLDEATDSRARKRRSHRTEREIHVIDANDSQVSGSPSDHRSSGPTVPGALSALVARWGLGGALSELEQLAADHAGLPAEADAARVALAGLVAAYAPPGSTSALLARRAEPCPLCAAEARFLARMAEVARG